MIVRERFTALQRLLHWLMAVCIVAMLFIGVGMVSTVMPKYLTLVSIHKPLGIAILVLALIRLAVRLRSGAPPLPAAQIVPISSDDLAKRGPDFLEQEIVDRVGRGPLHWTMVVTVANPGDPTSDPTKAWPEDRRTVEVGTLTVQRIEAEADGPCRDINFDPTVLPSGIRTSDDPFPAARSSVYAKSYDLRTAEAADYPRTETGTKP